jgi:hypothetical protein
MAKGRKLLLGMLAAVSALLCLAPLAQADYDPLGTGQTKLTLDKSLLSLLKANGVKLKAVAPAKLKGGAVSFPISGGKFDPTAAKGFVEHEGALVFQAGSRSVPLKAPQLKTTSKHSPITAKVGGSQLKIATASSLKATRSGFGEKVAVSGLDLSAKLATRLSKKLRLRDVFKAGLPLGVTATKANPLTISVLGQGRASLTLDSAFQAKLASLFVAVNPIFPAEHPGPFTLAIFGGTISPNAKQGTVETEGALEFIQLGGGQIFWGENWLDLPNGSLSPEVNIQPAPPFGGKLGRQGVAALSLAGAKVAADSKARTVAVEGAALSLSGSSAQQFNEVFAKPQGKSNVFASGEAVGSISFTAQGQ